MRKRNISVFSRKYGKVILLASLGALALAACTLGAPAPRVEPLATIDPAPTVQATEARTSIREAQVQKVEIQVTGMDPVQVNAIVRGNLSASCAQLGQSQVQELESQFLITVYEESPADPGCTPGATPFETSIPLHTNGLPQGTYAVVANGVSAVFTLPGTPAPSPMPTVGVTVAPAVGANTNSRACQDAAKFLADVSVPDNSLMAPNAPFNKIWRLQNTGTCTWDSSYLVYYVSGATMSQSPGYPIVAPGQVVAPGQSVDISVGMTSPPERGTYQSYWGLKKEQGALIPIQGGANGNSFYAKIKVDPGDASGQVTAASIGIELEQGSGSACTAGSTYFVQADITADGPTSAAYEISSTAGQGTAGNFEVSPGSGLTPVVTGALVFGQAETKRIALHFVGPYPYPEDITVTLRVNGGELKSAKLACQ